MAATCLTELTLSHFRCFGNAVIRPGSAPIILTGANGCGKTSILEAVSLCSPGRGLRRATVEEMANLSAGTGWKVVCGLGSGNLISSWWQHGPGRRVEVDGKPVRQTDLSRYLRVLWLTPSMDRLWSEGAEGRRRFLDRMAMSLFPDHPEMTGGYDKAMRERNRMLRDGIEDASWFNALEARMAESGAGITRGRQATIAKLEAAFASAASAFPAAGLRLISSADACAASESPNEIAEALSRGRGRDFKAGRTLAGPHRADLQVDYLEKATAARYCSTGEQKALLISIMLANARAVASESIPPVLLLDEIAAHLDGERLRLLFGEIRDLTSQTWMTGTDISVFGPIADAAQKFWLRGAAGGSEIQQL